MLRVVPLALLLAGCISANSTEVHKSETPPSADDSPALQAEIETLRAENESLRRRVDELEFRMAQYREMPADQPGSEPVLEVVNEFLLLPREIYNTVGVENWVHLRRGAKYVGRARILQITSRGTTARFDPEYPGPSAPPRVGDIIVSLPKR